MALFLEFKNVWQMHYSDRTQSQKGRSFTILNLVREFKHIF